jgi:hypothetical protein
MTRLTDRPRPFRFPLVALCLLVLVAVPFVRLAGLDFGMARVGAWLASL